MEKEDEKSSSEGKSAGETVFERVQGFIMSSDLEKDFEDFADEHAGIFMQALDMDANSAEHPLEMYDVYKAYLDQFEGRIERFIESEGLNSFDFYKECELILDNDEVFDMKRFFVETLLSTSKYETFFSLMKGEMMRIKATSKK